MTHSQPLVIFFTVSSIIFNIHAQYIGKPQTNEIKAVLKHSVELKCEYTGEDGNGQFIEWYKDGVAVSTEKAGHYAVTTTEKESTLTIKIFVVNDTAVQFWQVKTNKPGYEEPSECRFEKISAIPSPQSIETNRANEKIESRQGSIRRSEDKAVVLKCIIEPKPENYDENEIIWEYSKDEESYSTLPLSVTKEGDKISIEHVKKFHNGFYQCAMNNVTFSVLLRVKDRLAALWPFIGIVSVVIVLVIIILIFEKRQKSNKKSSADDDDQDQANDPLVRATTNPSDNDTKKRAVNA
ncbi:unnamed protein product [Rotaria socialis]|uniref:Ig-like domain-containing protein n=2 Tax=Rotaria socialis TaxID=392032 RepID=A0A820BDP8_9BILA|nr:unnamed protein product [Rotaria socialis]CAF3620808.1 unnamed protein product [Rotaria socialis]CAF4191005.1 unnamed protein product [Rotaria socialis]CAF4923744.1 unnamed protein product [Rotaria socialis]